MFFDIMELTTTYMQYLYLLIRMCPENYPSFFVEPFHRLLELGHAIFSVSDVSTSTSPYTVASVRLPVWLPYNFVLQFGFVCVVLPLILSTLGVLAVGGKVAYVKLLVLLATYFMMVFGSALLTGHYPDFSYQIVPTTTRIVFVALGTPLFVFLTAISLYVGYRSLMRQYRRERAFFARMLEEECNERAAYSNTESISNREKISLVSLAVHRAQVQRAQQSIARFSLRDAVMQEGFVLTLVVVVLFVCNVIHIRMIIQLPRTILTQVLAGALIAVALLCQMWMVLSFWRGGRVWRHRISTIVNPIVLTLILFSLSFLYTMMVTNFVLILYCETVTCWPGTRFHAIDSVFPLGSNDTTAVQAQCIPFDLHAYPQQCDAALQHHLETRSTSEQRLVYDSSVNCMAMSDFIAIGAALVFASYILLVPLLMFVLARYSVRVLRTEYPMEQRLKDTFSERELYQEKVSRSDNPAQNVFRAYKLEYRYYSLSFMLQKIILSSTSCIMQGHAIKRHIWVGYGIFCVVTTVSAGCALYFRPFARPTESIYFPVLQIMVAVTSLFGIVMSTQGLTTATISFGVFLAVLIIFVPLVTIVVGTILTLRNDRTQQEKLRERLESRFSADVGRHQKMDSSALLRQWRASGGGGGAAAAADDDEAETAAVVGDNESESHVKDDVYAPEGAASSSAWTRMADCSRHPSRRVSELDSLATMIERANNVNADAHHNREDKGQYTNTEDCSILAEADVTKMECDTSPEQSPPSPSQFKATSLSEPHAAQAAREESQLNEYTQRATPHTQPPRESGADDKRANGPRPDVAEVMISSSSLPSRREKSRLGALAHACSRLFPVGAHMENSWLRLRSLAQHTSVLFSIIIGGSDILYDEVDAEDTTHALEAKTDLGSESSPQRRARRRRGGGDNYNETRPLHSRGDYDDAYNNTHNTGNDNHVNNTEDNVSREASKIASDDGMTVWRARDANDSHRTLGNHSSPSRTGGIQYSPPLADGAEEVHDGQSNHTGLRSPGVHTVSQLPSSLNRGMHDTRIPSAFSSASFAADRRMHTAGLQTSLSEQARMHKDDVCADTNNANESDRRTPRGAALSPCQHSVSFQPDAERLSFTAHVLPTGGEETHMSSFSHIRRSSSTPRTHEGGTNMPSSTEQTNPSNQLPPSPQQQQHQKKKKKNTEKHEEDGWWRRLRNVILNRTKSPPSTVAVVLSSAASPTPRRRSLAAAQDQSELASSVEYPTRGFVFVPSLYFAEKYYPTKTTGRRRGRILPWWSRPRRDEGGATVHVPRRSMDDVSSSSRTMHHPHKDHRASEETNHTDKSCATNHPYDDNTNNHVNNNFNSNNMSSTNMMEKDAGDVSHFNGIQMSHASPFMHTDSNSSIIKDTTTHASLLGDALTRFVFPLDGASETAHTTAAHTRTVHTNTRTTSPSHRIYSHTVPAWIQAWGPLVSSARPLTFGDVARLRARSQAALSPSSRAPYTRPCWHRVSEEEENDVCREVPSKPCDVSVLEREEEEEKKKTKTKEKEKESSGEIIAAKRREDGARQASSSFSSSTMLEQSDDVVAANALRGSQPVIMAPIMWQRMLQQSVCAHRPFPPVVSTSPCSSSSLPRKVTRTSVPPSEERTCREHNHDSAAAEPMRVLSSASGKHEEASGVFAPACMGEWTTKKSNTTRAECVEGTARSDADAGCDITDKSGAGDAVAKHVATQPVAEAAAALHRSRQVESKANGDAKEAGMVKKHEEEEEVVVSLTDAVGNDITPSTCTSNMATLDGESPMGGTRIVTDAAPSSAVSGNTLQATINNNTVNNVHHNTAHSSPNLVPEDILALSSTSFTTAANSTRLSFLAAVRARLRRRSGSTEAMGAQSAQSAAASAPPLHMDQCLRAAQRQFGDICDWWMQRGLPIPIANWTPKKSASRNKTFTHDARIQQQQQEMLMHMQQDKQRQASLDASYRLGRNIMHHRVRAVAADTVGATTTRCAGGHGSTLTLLEETELAKMTLEAHTRETRERRRLHITANRCDDDEEYDNYNEQHRQEQTNEEDRDDATAKERRRRVCSGGGARNYHTCARSRCAGRWLTRRSDVHRRGSSITPSLGAYTRAPSCATGVSSEDVHGCCDEEEEIHTKKSCPPIHPNDVNSDNNNNKKKKNKDNHSTSRSREDSRMNVNTCTSQTTLHAAHLTRDCNGAAKGRQTDKQLQRSCDSRANCVCGTGSSRSVALSGRRYSSWAPVHPRARTALSPLSATSARCCSLRAAADHRSVRTNTASDYYTSQLNTIMSIMGGAHSVCAREGHYHTSSLYAYDGSTTHTVEHARNSFDDDDDASNDMDAEKYGYDNNCYHSNLTHQEGTKPTIHGRDVEEAVTIHDVAKLGNGWAHSKQRVGGRETVLDEHAHLPAVMASPTHRSASRQTCRYSAVDVPASQQTKRSFSSSCGLDSDADAPPQRPRQRLPEQHEEEEEEAQNNSTNTPPPPPLWSSAAAHTMREEDARLLRRLRYHHLLRDYFLRGYWFNKKRLRSVQFCIDGKISRFTQRTMQFFLLFLGFVTSCAFALILSGMLSWSYNSDFVSASEFTASTMYMELAGYGSWSEFTSNCCCVAATHLTPQNPFFAVDAEDWLCANGRVKERIRRRAVTTAVSKGYGDQLRRLLSAPSHAVMTQDGYDARSLCGMTFAAGCHLDVDATNDHVKLQCSNTSIPAYTYDLW